MGDRPCYFKVKSTVYKETKWLRFILTDRKPKTVIIGVYNTSDQFLGDIRWYGPWRQYIYSPCPQAQLTFNNGCLQDIADVLTCLNNEHKQEHVKKDGIYLLRDQSGYEKTVEASFNAHGKLVRLVDKDGNNWIDWAKDVLWTEPRESHQ